MDMVVLTQETLPALTRDLARKCLEQSAATKQPMSFAVSREMCEDAGFESVDAAWTVIKSAIGDMPVMLSTDFRRVIYVTADATTDLGKLLNRG